MFGVGQVFVCLCILSLSKFSIGLNLNTDLLQHSQSQCNSHYNGTILQHPTDCHKFFVCANSQPQEYNCEPNFHFDKNSRSCVAGNKCENNYEIVQPSLCHEGAINAVADDCYKFEACVNGQYQKLNCPSGYYFDAPDAVCRTIEYNVHFKCNCLVPDHTVLQNSDNCQTFFLCKDRKAWLQKCDEDQYYESTVNTCLLDLEGDCVMEPTKTPPTLHVNKVEEIISEEAVKTLCERSVGGVVKFSPCAENCNKFQMCVNGQLYTKECPEGLYYDDDRKYCVVDTKNICRNGRIMLEPQKLNESKVLKPKIPPQSSNFMGQTIMMPPHLLAFSKGHNKVFSKLIKF